MASIRRSGGMTVWFWEGPLPDPASEEFRAALARNRFRTIENAASEEVSVGWVTKGDPTGDSFDEEDLDAGPATWLRMRIDKKKLPARWLAIHREVAEKQRGRRLSARERRELRDGLMDSLLPRVLPAVAFADALLFAGRSTALLLATGRGVGEAFAKLFFETFSLPIDRATPRDLALRCALGTKAAAIDRISPIRWPSESRGATSRGPRDGIPRGANAPAEAEAEA
ncbi:MAG: hypothetical protein Fur0037_08320 [Planctomycetota bacterium]